MKTLDEALVELRQNSSDVKKQSQFYDLFLNSSFLVPVTGSSDKQDEAAAEGKDVVPLVIEAEGNDFLMLFSSLERLKGWSHNDENLRYLEVPGHVLALNAGGGLHWAMDAGTEQSKRFYPAEIDWLKQAVEHCNAEAAKAAEQGGCCG